MDKLNHSNNEQTSSTLHWLQTHFYGRSGVSISRCSMYSLYTAFCQQNNYRPVCKATFGKLIRIQFAFVTSKRLGARGQSKYHYYGIALKDKAHNNSNVNDDSDKSVTRFSRNSRCLNPNDYHAILHSMFSESGPQITGPLMDNKIIFSNIYKIHCQCLVDAALSINYSQMRHYIMHFWHQLPSHIQIDLDTLKQHDMNFYSTLEDIYLKIDAPLDQLKHLNAIAMLNPLWLQKATDVCEDRVRQFKLKEAYKWKSRVKTQFQFIRLAKTIDISLIYGSIHSMIEILRQIDYDDELILVNDTVLHSFMHLLNGIRQLNGNATIGSIIDTIDDVIKSIGTVFCRKLTLEFCHIQLYILKKLTQIQSPLFIPCHMLLTFINDYLLTVCQQ